MALVSLILELDADAANALSDACFEAGALSVSADDPLAGTPQEVPLYGEPGHDHSDWGNPGEPAMPAAREGFEGWARLRLAILLDESVDAKAFLGVASRAAGLTQLPPYRLERVADDDWVKKTQAQFQPIRISERLWIVPSWHAAPDSDALNIALDPGVAFGTGSHPTTQLCLQWLERQVTGGECVLDYGCGSGILAIAAARLGAGRVLGVDIDPAAVLAARDNAARNGVAAEFMDASAELDVQADLLVANILSNPLKTLAPLLARHVRPSGSLALSGVLAAQAQEVMQVYGQWISFEAPVELEGWVCLSGRRTPRAA